MNLTDEELDQVRIHAGNLMPPAQIAEILQVNIDEFVNCIKFRISPIYDIYMSQFLQAKSDFNKVIVEKAKGGDYLAQLEMKDLLRKTQISLITGV